MNAIHLLPRRRNHGAFTLVELLAVIAIVAILAALLFAVISKSIGSARQAKSASNLRQWHLALSLYAADNDQKIPLAMENATVRQNAGLGGAKLWFQRLGDYMELELPANMVDYPRETIVSCPNYPSERRFGKHYIAYGISRHVTGGEGSSYSGPPMEQKRLHQVSPNTIIIADSVDDYNLQLDRPEGERRALDYRHGEYAQALLLNGSVIQLRRGEPIPPHLIDPELDK